MATKVDLLLERMSSPEVKKAVECNSLVVIPVGQIEEHGLHLPINTDAVLAAEIAKRAARVASKEISVVVAPTVQFGYSQVDVMKYAGTFSLKPVTFMNLVADICGSLVRQGFKKIVILNSHGQNINMLKVTLRRIRDETGVAIALIPLIYSLAVEELSKLRKSDLGGIFHAGELETSLLLAIQPDLVDMTKAKKEVTKLPPPLSGDGLVSSKVFLTTWSLWKSKYGVMGDPTVASKETGEDFLQTIINKIAEFFVNFGKGELARAFDIEN
jgi:creatinine amidohydrolase